MTQRFPTLEDRLAARIRPPDATTVMYQTWEELLFLHWKYPVEEVQRTLPAGLTVDTFEGDAYVAVTPFYVSNVRAPFVPPLPLISHFQELNVRTYVFDRRGTPGIWFYSLDCDQPLAVWAARAGFALPYFHAQMSSARDAWLDFTCTRAESNAPARFRYRGSGSDSEAAPGSLEFFLIERYFLFALRERAGTLLRAQVSHTPYPIRNAEVEEFSTIPAQLDGLRDFGRKPDHVCLTPRLDVEIFAPESVD